MESKRIHKDIKMTWPILTNGEAISLAGRDLKLIIINPKGGETELPFTYEGNILTTTFYGKDHKYCGTHGLTLWENYGKIGMTAVDKTKAFRLVPSTELERSNPESEGLDIEDVILEGGNIEVGVGGGQDGRGIASIEQTTTSTEDGGINIITQTLTDGTEATFQIRNGSRGSQGIQGERGPQGIQGETGPQGLQGERGLQGEKGDQGPKGDTGDTGPTGPQGPAGADWIPTSAELQSIAQSAAQYVTVPTKTSDLNNDSHFVVSTAITNIVSMSQSAYDALATKDANTLYIIPEE